MFTVGYKQGWLDGERIIVCNLMEKQPTHTNTITTTNKQQLKYFYHYTS